MVLSLSEALMIKTTCPFVRSLFPIWFSAQTNLGAVFRWQNHPQVSQGRKQSTLAHTVSLAFLGTIALPILQSHNQDLESDLLLASLVIHDFSEGVLNRDILASHKREEDDLQEYLSFREFFRHCAESWTFCEKAFLLQFVRKPHRCFPNNIQEKIKKIALSNELEAMMFEAIERLDYILYAREHCETSGDNRLLHEVMTRHGPILGQLRSKIRGFEKIWTPQFEHECSQLVQV